VPDSFMVRPQGAAGRENLRILLVKIKEPLPGLIRIPAFHPSLTSGGEFTGFSCGDILRLLYSSDKTFMDRRIAVKERTRDNIYQAFVGEAKAYFRLLAYAEKADEEEVPQIALLFRAIADAERVHATRHLNSLKDIVVKDTDTNLEASFQREKTVSENVYPDFIQQAEEDGEKVAAIAFTQARDAETYHAKLYERAIMNVIKNVEKAYHVCQVCGYVTEKKIPKKCPVCGAPKEKFKTIEP
jgi:rubrerythrin